MVSRIIKFINSEINNTHKAAYILGFVMFFTQMFALLRDKIFAHYFGAGEVLDIYYASFRIPDLIFITLGSFVAASIIIPELAVYLNRKSSSASTDIDIKNKENNFINSIFSFFFLSVLGVVVIFYFLTPHLIDLFLAGFSVENKIKAVETSRILLLSPIILGVSNFLSNIVQVKGRFLLYSLSPLFYNIGIIIGTIIFGSKFGPQGLAFGVVLGGLLHMVIQLPFIIEQKLIPKITFKIDFIEIKKIIKIAVPRTVAVSINNFYSLFLISVASFMPLGSVSVYNFSYNIQTVPLSIIGISYSTAVFPTLSKIFKEGSRELFLAKFLETIKHMIFWCAPTTVFFVILRAQVIRVVYGSGEFDWADTRLTAAVCAVFALSIIAQSLILLFMRAHYARGDNKKPIMINLLTLFLIVLLTYLFRNFLVNNEVIFGMVKHLLKIEDLSGTEVVVLPLAYTLAIWVNALIHLFIFNKTYSGLFGSLKKIIFETFSSSIISGFATYYSLIFWNNFFPLTTTFNVFMQGLLSGLIGIIVYILVLHLLKNSELEEVFKTLKKKIWKEAPIADISPSL